MLLGAQEKCTEAIKKNKTIKTSKKSKQLKNSKKIKKITKNYKKESQKGAAALKQRQQTKRMGEGVGEGRSSRGESCVSEYFI